MRLADAVCAIAAGVDLAASDIIPGYVLTNRVFTASITVSKTEGVGANTGVSHGTATGARRPYSK